MGDVRGAFRYALDCLRETDGIAVAAVSSLWRTPPWGKTDQPDFLNLAVALRVNLTPHELLATCQAIEEDCGRVRDIRWGPRTLDIDIITFDDETIDEPDLKLPHPHAIERAFVLAPLAEIAPELEIDGRRVDAWLAAADLAGARSIGPLGRE